MSNILNKHIIILLVCGLCFTSVQSQNIESYIINGDAAFSSGNYEVAWENYKNAVNIDELNLYAWYQMGISAMRFFDYTKSYSCFKMVYENDSANKYPLTAFYLGELSRNLSDYNMAKAYYSIFLEIHRKDCDHAEKSKKQIDFINKKMYEENPDVKIEHIPIPINSPYSEASGFQAEDKYLYFTSLQPLIKSEGIGIIENSFLTSIYVSQFTHTGLSRPKLFDNEINSKNEHTANICFNEDYTTAWFNRCKMKGNYKWKCDIYESKLNGETWTKAQKLDLNTEEATSTQSFFVNDTAGNEILYFVSNREGGYGGMDIWFSIRKNGKFESPINCGSIINSPGNEITPFFDTVENKLYFSSDWFGGFGSYDIFSTNGSLCSWSSIENIGKPFNSAANDFAFNINRTDRDGYFTSNRQGSYYLKNETCCNDLYAYYRKETIKVDSLPPDTIINEISNLENQIKKILPLNLYFHNDIPNPRSKDSTTTLTYTETYYEYYSMIEKYLKEYCRGLSSQDMEKARNDIEDFFMNSVSGGYKKLIEFLPLVKEDLNAGSKVQIKIKGFASPLTSTEYNILLSKRRISSIINDLQKFDKNSLGKYLENGQLTIYSDPVGEALSDQFVSDNPNDARNSIYSISAAKERKIQIVNYESDFAGSKVEKPREAVLVLETNNLKFHFSDKDFCKKIKIENIGDDTLKIKNISAEQSWLSGVADELEIAPGKNTHIKVCIKAEMLNKKTLGLIVIDSNSTDEKNVIYVRVEPQ